MLLAYFDTQLELQVAEDLFDHALHFLSRDFLLGIRQGQAKGHALFAIAKVSAAIDIEQLDLADQRAGLADGLLDLAAGHSLAADQSQIAFDRCIGTERLIAQFAFYTRHQCLVVQFAQIDVLAVLLLLGNLKFGVDLVGQLAEHAQTLAVAVDGGADAGVEPAGGLTLIGEGQVKALSQCFQSALDGEEVLFILLYWKVA